MMFSILKANRELTKTYPNLPKNRELTHFEKKPYNRIQNQPSHWKTITKTGSNFPKNKIKNVPRTGTSPIMLFGNENRRFLLEPQRPHNTRAKLLQPKQFHQVVEAPWSSMQALWSGTTEVDRHSENRVGLLGFHQQLQKTKKKKKK